MGITTPAYVTREDVQFAANFNNATGSDALVDRAIDAGSRAVEILCRQAFYPWTGTRYFDYPSDQTSRSWDLWLERNYLLSATSVVSGGTTIAPADYFLEPNDEGPPYDRLSLNTGTVGSFDTGSTDQRNIAITGVFAGAPDTRESAGLTSEALDTTETGVDVNGPVSAAVGVGDVLLVESERMLVVERTWVNVDVAGDLTLSKSDEDFTVVTGSQFAAGEKLLVGSERLLLRDITSNTLIVKRAVDGTTLAAHTGGPVVYSNRSLTVVRGALGTTAAAHNTSSPVYIQRYPASIRELALAEALVSLGQQAGSYGRTSGSGDNSATPPSGTLDDLRKRVRKEFGRYRTAVI